MSIQLSISGNPSDIRVAAHWLTEHVRQGLIDADLEMVSMISDSQYLWTGQSGYAFTSAAQAVRRGNFESPRYAGDVAEVLRAYAGRLERGQEDFDDLAAYARRQGLSVMANAVVAPTTWLTFCPGPNGEDSPELTEWNRYQEKVDVYNEIADRVGTWWGELDTWIAEHFGPLVQGVEDLKEGATVLEGLIEGNETVVNYAFEYASARSERDLASFRRHVSELQEDANRFQRQLRSGNPAVRAAAEAADPAAMRQGVRALNEMIDGVSRTTKIIPVAGTVIDIVSAGAQISAGESPSSVGVETAGGIVGGAGAAAAVAAASGPPGWVAAAAVAGAMAVGAGSRWAWEAWVPLDTREAIDDGLRDAWDFIFPPNWFVDTP